MPLFPSQGYFLTVNMFPSKVNPSTLNPGLFFPPPLPHTHPSPYPEEILQDWVYSTAFDHRWWIVFFLFFFSGLVWSLIHSMTCFKPGKRKSLKQHWTKGFFFDNYIDYLDSLSAVYLLWNVSWSVHTVEYYCA